MARDRRKTKSKYTADRNIPGAFEGETVTRRRFMTGTVHAGGIVATAAFVLPALGFALGPVFEKTEHRWEAVGPTDDFTRDTYIPKVITETSGIGDVGKTTVYVRQHDDADRRASARRVRLLRRDLDPLHARRLPGALRVGGRALHLPVSRQRVRLPGQALRRPAVRPLDRFYTRVRDGQVEIGPRYSVNSELRRFSPRDPGEPLDGIGQYLYPSRPTIRKIPGTS